MAWQLLRLDMLRPFRTGLVAIVVFWGSLAVFMVVTQMVAASIGPASLPRLTKAQLDRGEPCDGTNLSGRNRRTLGFASGELACRPADIFDTSGCRR